MSSKNLNQGTCDTMTLIEEANIRYPKGTVFKSAVSNTQCISGGNAIVWPSSSYPDAIGNDDKDHINTSGILYANGKWAEIVSKPLEWKIGAYVRYKGTKVGTGDWKRYFGDHGIKKGDVATIYEIHSEGIFTKDTIRSNNKGKLNRNDLELITEEEYKAGLRTVQTPSQLLFTSKFKEGDVVKVIRKSSSGERGWSNDWISEMDSTVGKSFIIQTVQSNDYLLSSGFNYPEFVLELSDDIPENYIITAAVNRNDPGILYKMCDINKIGLSSKSNCYLRGYDRPYWNQKCLGLSCESCKLHSSHSTIEEARQWLGSPLTTSIKPNNSQFLISTPSGVNWTTIEQPLYSSYVGSSCNHIQLTSDGLEIGSTDVMDIHKQKQSIDF